MKPELKPCPFCGGHAVYEYEEYDKALERQGVRAVCGNCGIGTMIHPLKDLVSEHPEKYTPIFPKDYTPFDGHEIAAKEWNRRNETPSQSK